MAHGLLLADIEKIKDIALWVVVLAGAMFVVFLGVMAIRRMALGLNKSSRVNPMEEFTRLLRQGKISQEEYDRGRRKMLNLPERPESPTGQAARR